MVRLTFTVRVTYIAALPDESLTFKGHGIAADHIHVYGCRIDYDIIRHIDIVGGGRTGIALGCSENNVHWIAAMARLVKRPVKSALPRLTADRLPHRAGFTAYTPK